jgi:23S rRNA pseudouridine2457 synthase
MTRPRLLLLNKPSRVLTQFTSEDGKASLHDIVKAPDMYPAGRLDYDSEGLLLLTNWGALQAKLAEPRFKVPKTYFVQVEGVPDDAAIGKLRAGVQLNDGMTRPAEATAIAEPDWLWPRDPPIRFRRDIPTHWVSLTIREGRNRQVRRMTAAVGHPTLRLIRWSIGPWSLKGLKPGESRDADPQELGEFLRSSHR